MATAHVARGGEVLKLFMDVIFPGDVPLLEADHFQLGAQSIDKSLHGIGEKGQYLSPGLAGLIQLAIIFRACLVVVITEKMGGRAWHS